MRQPTSNTTSPPGPEPKTTPHPIPHPPPQKRAPPPNTPKNTPPTTPRPPPLPTKKAHLTPFAAKHTPPRPPRPLPHRATPATIYTARPKANPTTRIDTHNRVRTDRVDQAGSITLRHNGRLHHIGVGRIHYRTRVLILAQDLNIRIINAATGELLRDFTLDPTRD